VGGVAVHDELVGGLVGVADEVLALEFPRAGAVELLRACAGRGARESSCEREDELKAVIRLKPS
jgi:hypothetical protein